MTKKFLTDFSAIFLLTAIALILPTMSYGQSTSNSKITLLSFNAWEGGINVNDGQSKALNAILKSGADIIGICEANENIGNFIADRLGWYRYITDDNNIVSRYPIIKTWNTVKSACAEIEIENGKVIVVEMAHLYYTPYGPYRACLDNAAIEQIIKEENTSGRMEEIGASLESINVYLKNGTPTFLMGDFNVPSHLDWTKQTADKHCGYIIEWPVTKSIEESGMKDSYREAYPDPEAFPGITWSPIYKKVVNENGKPEPLDRIDFIYYAGDNVKLLSSETFVMATPGQISNHQQNEWPSDHAAVISSFSVEINAGINFLPEAKFYVSTPVVKPGEKITFTDISTNKPASWSWIFEGGTPANSSGQNPVVTYSTAGSYSVTLISTNAMDSDTTTVTGLVVVKP